MCTVFQNKDLAPDPSLPLRISVAGFSFAHARQAPQLSGSIRCFDRALGASDDCLGEIYVVKSADNGRRAASASASGGGHTSTLANQIFIIEHGGLDCLCWRSLAGCDEKSGGRK